MDLKEKGFISSLPVTTAQLIGVFDNYIYAISDTKNQIRIYKKEIINTGDWKLIWSKPVKLLESKKCRFDCEDGILVFGLSTNSILIFYGTGTYSKIIFKLIKLDLKTVQATEIVCNFEDTDFFIEHLSEICMACQNSQISCRNSDETSFILTHFGEYLTTMTFEIDFLEGTIARREIKFSVSEIFENEVSNVAINSVGVVAVIGGNKMLCTEFKSDDNEYTETWFDFDELSDLPQLNDCSKINLYSVGNIFKCFILDETYKCYNINFSYKSENNRFTLLNAKKIPSFNPYKSREILITNEYFFVTDDSSNEMVTFVSRILSLSEAAYLTLQKHEKMSLMKLKKRMGFPKCLPITRAPK